MTLFSFDRERTTKKFLVKYRIGDRQSISILRDCIIIFCDPRINNQLHYKKAFVEKKPTTVILWSITNHNNKSYNSIPIFSQQFSFGLFCLSVPFFILTQDKSLNPKSKLCHHCLLFLVQRKEDQSHKMSNHLPIIKYYYQDILLLEPREQKETMTALVCVTASFIVCLVASTVNSARQQFYHMDC